LDNSHERIVVGDGRSVRVRALVTAGSGDIPARQVRGMYDEHTIVVYQAYSREIAENAVAAGRFVPPFKLDRMTWIKPSFRWMMYRSGWATKAGQEHVLAVTIARTAFEWALAHSCLTHYDPHIHSSREEWANCTRTSPVQVQWDPERSLLLEPLGHRAIQVGLRGEAVARYVSDWIVELGDITTVAHEVHELVRAGDLGAATRRLPTERPYPLPEHLERIVGVT
jgi:hypothetical protein